MNEPLKFELHDQEKANYFRLYECEHITEGTHPMSKEFGNILHVGSHASILLCKHCWQHVKGMVMEEVVKDAVRKYSIEEIREKLDRTLEAA